MKNGKNTTLSENKIRKMVERRKIYTPNAYT